MNIHALPDLCLLNIFSRLPLLDLVRIGQVCTRWKLFQSHVTSRVRSLTLLIGQNSFELIQENNFEDALLSHILNDDGTPMYQTRHFSAHSSMHFKWLLTETVVGLGNTFPNVTSLEISIFRVMSPQFCSVAFLLQFWRSKLTTLKMYTLFGEFYGIPEFISVQLFNAINSLTSLKHLLLDCHQSFSRAAYHDEIQIPYHRTIDLQETRRINLPILAQLDQFDFYSCDEELDLVWDSLLQYAQPNDGLRIRYGYSAVSEHSLKLAQLDAQFCRQFTNILPGDPLPSTGLNTFCSRFTSVTTANFMLENISIDFFFAKLAKLTQLLQLNVTVNFSAIENDNHEDDIPLAQLHSLKSLDVFISLMTSHANMALLNLPWTCPNLQVMQVDVQTFIETRCTICGYALAEYNTEDYFERLEPCLGLVLMPLGQCPRLRMVTKYSAGILSVDHITAQQLKQPFVINKIYLWIDIK